MRDDDSVIPYRIDGLQYSAWSRKIFQQMRAAQLDAVHVTIGYHEDFKAMVENIVAWNRLFEEFSELIFQGFDGNDIDKARAEGRTAIFFGLQTPAPIEADIGLVDILYQLGVRFMQLSYNNQSLLASGCYEACDSGITRMGRQVIQVMNRCGLVVDMSHSAETSTLQAIDISHRPIAITHANSHSWAPALRNKSDNVLKALGDSGGMLGLSLYPHHLKDKSACTITSFCDMIKRVVDIMGINHVGIGSDLCQDQPDSIVEWMRNGRWTHQRDYGEGSVSQPGFPPQPHWFKDSRDIINIQQQLQKSGFSNSETAKIIGGNWRRFFGEAFGDCHKC